MNCKMAVGRTGCPPVKNLTAPGLGDCKPAPSWNRRDWADRFLTLGARFVLIQSLASLWLCSEDEGHDDPKTTTRLLLRVGTRRDVESDIDEAHCHNVEDLKNSPNVLSRRFHNATSSVHAIQTAAKHHRLATIHSTSSSCPATINVDVCLCLHVTAHTSFVLTSRRITYRISAVQDGQD